MKYEFVHKDAVKLFERSVKALEKNEEGSIYPYEFSNGVGIAIDHVKVNRDQDGRIILNLDEECGKDYAVRLPRRGPAYPCWQHRSSPENR